MTTQNEVKIDCPPCGKDGDIHKIIYGMPTPEFDFDNYESGGCVIFDEAPNWMCRNCRWEGVRKPPSKKSAGAL